jgi:hypothetical protein
MTKLRVAIIPKAQGVTVVVCANLDPDEVWPFANKWAHLEFGSATRFDALLPNIKSRLGAQTDKMGLIYLNHEGEPCLVGGQESLGLLWTIAERLTRRGGRDPRTDHDVLCFVIPYDEDDHMMSSQSGITGNRKLAVSALLWDRAWHASPWGGLEKRYHKSYRQIAASVAVPPPPAPSAPGQTQGATFVFALKYNSLETTRASVLEKSVCSDVQTWPQVVGRTWLEPVAARLSWAPVMSSMEPSKPRTDSVTHKIS